MKYSKYAAMLLLIFCFIFTNFAYAGKKKKGVQTQTQSSLTITESGRHEAELKMTGKDEYEIMTTGSDPYVFTVPLVSMRNPEHTVLSFQYFCPKGLSHLEVYFFTKDGSHTSKMINNVSISEGWVSFAADLAADIKEWGKPGDYLRLDFGDISGVLFRMRNPVIRSQTVREKELADSKIERKKKEAVLESNLSKYLASEFTSSLSDINAGENTIKITGRTENIKNVFLCEVPPYQDVTEEKKFETAVPVKESDIYMEIPRFIDRNGIKYDRLLSKWVLAEKNEAGYKIISHARYADEIKSKYDYPEEKPGSKKGLGGFGAGRGYMEDLDSLNITSATVNIWITGFMYTKPAPDRIEHDYNGKKYYFGKKDVEEYDSTFRTLSRKNIVAAAILLIGKAENCADPEIGRLMQHPDCDPAGIYSMPNMTTPESVECYAAALDFLASRYSRADKKYGRCHHWIMHNEVDAGWVWTNAGDKTAPVFMDLYIKSMRMCYNIARSYNPHSQVFVSMTHYWAWTSEPKFYPTKTLMQLLLQYSKDEGDFEWAVAQHPYPEDLFEPKTWLDKKATFDLNSPLITFKNLEVLNAWIKSPEVLYKGKYKRLLWLSENGTNSRDYSEQSLTEQAAGFAYTWKKMEVLDGIDGFQWHNWVDNRGEGGLRIGLRRFPDDEKDPGGRKPVWYVYEAAGTEKEDAVYEKYKKVIGIQDWDEVRYKGELDQSKKKTPSEM